VAQEDLALPRSRRIHPIRAAPLAIHHRIHYHGPQHPTKPLPPRQVLICLSWRGLMEALVFHYLVPRCIHHYHIMLHRAQHTRHHPHRQFNPQSRNRLPCPRHVHLRERPQSIVNMRCILLVRERPLSRPRNKVLKIGMKLHSQWRPLV